MDSPPDHRAGRIAGLISGRALLIVTAVLTMFATASVLINNLVLVVYMYEGAYDLEVLLLSPEGSLANLKGDSEQTTSYLSTVLISSHESLDTARLLQSLAIGLTTITFLAGAAVILILCRRLWSGRAFSTSAAVSIFVLAGMALLTAWLAPFLRHRADEVALNELGYATSGTELWVDLPYSVVDDSMLMLGAVLVLIGLVYLAARKLQRETEGLV